MKEQLATLTPEDLGPDGGFILLFPVRNLFPEAPAFRLPREEQVFLFDILTSGSLSDPDYISRRRVPASRGHAISAVRFTQSEHANDQERLDPPVWAPLLVPRGREVVHRSRQDSHPWTGHFLDV